MDSDRNIKTNFQENHPSVGRNHLAALPIATWSYTNSPSIRHLGPTAQDFKAAFSLGGGDKHIEAVDGIGVALAAIQGLNQELKIELLARDERIGALEADLREDSEIAARLKTRLDAIEKMLPCRNVNFVNEDAQGTSSDAHQ